MSVSSQVRQIMVEMLCNRKEIAISDTYSKYELLSCGEPNASMASMPVKGAAGGRLSLAISSPRGSSNSLILKFRNLYL